MSLLLTIGAVFLLFFAAWLISVKLSDVSIIDSFWGLAFVLIAGLQLALGAGWRERSWLVFGLTALWGLRLSIYLTLRNHKQPEDKRYAAMRARHGEGFALRALWSVFLVQAVLSLLISAPIQVAMGSEGPGAWTLWDGLGAALFFVGFFVESIADAQMAAYKRIPKVERPAVMSRGLWGWSRHPNYFGEALLWWGFGLIALSCPSGVFSLAGPALITGLLLKVSGVTMLEDLMLREKGDEYRRYVETTASFVPWPKRRSEASQ